MTADDRALLRRAGIVLPEGSKVLATRLDGVEGAEPAKKPPQARYTKPGADGMNNLERAYDRHLAGRKLAGEIHDYKFQAMKLLIVGAVSKSGEADEPVKSSWYLPDFVVYETDGTVCFHETKGFKDVAGDAWLKFKSAASQHPFPFYFVQRKKGGWIITRHGR